MLFNTSRTLLIDICAPAKSNLRITIIKNRLTHIDFKKLVKLASMEFLSPLLYHNLKTIITTLGPEISAYLKNSYMQNTARNILLLKRIKLLKQAAEKYGIDIILLKGSAFAVSIYNEVGIRPMADVDILIKKEHIRKMKELMKEQSMYALFKTLRGKWFEEVKSHITPYQSADDILSLEIHTRLFDDRFIPFPPLNPFERTMKIKWDNENFYVLEPMTSFIYTLYHMSIHHNYSFRLRDFIDLSYLITAYSLEYGKIITYIEKTQAKGLFEPIMDTAFENAGIINKPEHTGVSDAYIYYVNSVVMKRVPIQISSRLTEATVRIATLMTSGFKKWAARIFKFTDYEVSVFYKTTSELPVLKRVIMGMWIISVGAGYLLIFPFFACIRKIRLK